MVDKRGWVYTPYLKEKGMDIFMKEANIKHESESSESEKIGLLETRLKDLDTKIAEEHNSEAKISLLLKYKALSQEYCNQLRESYGRLLTECVQNYQEALEVGEIFQQQANIYKKMLWSNEFECH